MRYLEESSKSGAVKTSDTAFRLPFPVAVAILAVVIFILVDSHRQANQSRYQRALASSKEVQRIERIECGRLVETWQELRPLNESKQVALGSTKQEAAEDHATQQSEYSALCQQLGISPYLTNLN